ncbi:MAG TPA: hypothetical protein VFO77_01735, partial [Actinoplanes sp.]|nr:hypothetical protein [Actinoplanes sp.]
MTSAPQPPPIEPPSDPWALPSTGQPTPITPYLDPEPHSRPPTGPAAAAYPMSQPGPVIVHIGELAVTSTLVRTPAGDMALAGSTWQVGDYWHNEQKT